MIVLSVPHSGTRSVARFLTDQGETVTRRYIQFPMPREEAQAIADRAVLVIRDPALPILSAIARADDRPWRVLWALDILYALRWPSRVFAVGIDKLPHVGKRDHLLKRLYLAGDRAGLDAEVERTQSRPWSLFDELGKREGIFRPRLEKLGYKALPWWN